MYPYYYRVNNWENVLHALHQSLFAEEMVCAMSSELFHIPETQGLEGNAEMHNHLVPASYHRVTAVGSAQRLMNGEQQQSIIETMSACIMNAEAQDKQVRQGLNTMERNASPSYKPVIAVIIMWQEQAEYYLNQAREASQLLGVSFSGESEEYNYN
ncbi:hypothetical protein ACFQ3N_17255 [Virgibacillus byunsanensis]|uniref:Uncharacterized protein n=1 Tax=Virgibacillus byunsanensis TaxID=570945 RepID=A0ABW3LQN3_9BACI